MPMVGSRVTDSWFVCVGVRFLIGYISFRATHLSVSFISYCFRLENVQPAYAAFNGSMYAGTIPTNHDKRRGEMMFWLFEPETQAVPDTIVLCK